MAQWVSFEDIKSRVSIEDVLDHYGIGNLKPRKNELVGLCPFPQHEDTRASFSANTIKNVFQCFGCKKSGNILDFVAQMEGCDIRQAALMTQEWFGIASEKPTNNSQGVTEGDTRASPCLRRQRTLL